MHNPASVLEKDTHKLLWDFDIQTDCLISTRKPDLIIINKKKKENLQNCWLCCPSWPQNKTERMWKKNKYIDLAWELKKTMEHENDNYTNCDWYFWYSNKRMIKGTGELGSWGTSEDHTNYSIIEDGQNTEKSLKELRGLAVTQTPLKDHLLKLMWKTLMR